MVQVLASQLLKCQTYDDLLYNKCLRTNFCEIQIKDTKVFFCENVFEKCHSKKAAISSELSFKFGLHTDASNI